MAYAKPPSECRTPNGDKLDYTPSTPTSGWESSPEIPSSSSGQRASSRAAGHLDSPSPSPRMTRTIPSTAGYPNTAKRSFHWLPVVQLFTNSDEDLATSSIRGSLTDLSQGPLAAEMPLRPWSCAKIARAETKRASRKKQLDKGAFFIRISRFLEAGPQDSIPVSSKRYASTMWSSALESMLITRTGRNTHSGLHKNFPLSLLLVFFILIVIPWYHLSLMRSGAHYQPGL